MNNGINFLKRQNNLIKNNDKLAKFIKEYGYDKCHFLSKAIAEHYKLKNIICFYFEKSEEVIHSGVFFEGNVVDARGISDIKEIQDFYDNTNIITNKYSLHGKCCFTILNKNDFDPNIFYINNVNIKYDDLVKEYVIFFGELVST